MDRIVFAAAYCRPDDPAAPETAVACAMCGHTGLSEDDQTDVGYEVVCRGCALEKLAGLAAIVLGHDYKRASKVEAANLLDPEIVTFKHLVRELEREVNALRR